MKTVYEESELKKFIDKMDKNPDEKIINELEKHIIDNGFCEIKDDNLDFLSKI